MTPSITAFRAILAKDLRAELRTLQSLPAMALFAVTAFVIFRFGLDRTSLDGELAAGVLVPTLLFAALLAINRLFVAEREEGGFDLVRLAPVDRTVLFADYMSPGTYVYEYFARATTPGVYMGLPAHAEMLYYPDVFGHSDGGQFTVR